MHVRWQVVSDCSLVSTSEQEQVTPEQKKAEIGLSWSRVFSTNRNVDGGRTPYKFYTNTDNTFYYTIYASKLGAHHDIAVSWTVDGQSVAPALQSSYLVYWFSKLVHSSGTAGTQTITGTLSIDGVEVETQSIEVQWIEDTTAAPTTPEEAKEKIGFTYVHVGPSDFYTVAEDGNYVFELGSNLRYFNAMIYGTNLSAGELRGEWYLDGDKVYSYDRYINSGQWQTKYEPEIPTSAQTNTLQVKVFVGDIEIENSEIGIIWE